MYLRVIELLRAVREKVSRVLILFAPRSRLNYPNAQSVYFILKYAYN